MYSYSFTLLVTLRCIGTASLSAFMFLGWWRGGQNTKHPGVYLEGRGT